MINFLFVESEREHAFSVAFSQTSGKLRIYSCVLPSFDLKEQAKTLHTTYFTKDYNSCSWHLSPLLTNNPLQNIRNPLFSKYIENVLLNILATTFVKMMIM